MPSKKESKATGVLQARVSRALAALTPALVLLAGWVGPVAAVHLESKKGLGAKSLEHNLPLSHNGRVSPGVAIQAPRAVPSRHAQWMGLRPAAR